MTINEISKLAGVSTATVSYVINNKSGCVSEEVRARVLKIIEENGYVPNKIARSLREKRSKTIGVLAEDITHFQTPGIIAGINSYLEQIDIHMILNNLSLTQKAGEHTGNVLQHKKEINDAIDILMEARVDGIIYIGWQDRDVGNLVKPLNVPLVYAYCFSEVDGRSWISYDNESSMEEILDKVFSLKHRKIAFVSGGDELCRPAEMRFNIYQKKLAAEGIPLRREYIKHGDWSFNAGRQFYRELVALEDPPTVILSLNDHMAGGMIKESMDTDRRILNEISVVGFNGFEFASFLSPTLATVSLPLEQIGYEAAKQLLTEINNKNCEHKQEFLKCQFVNGSSLKINPFA
ncbi:LacI family DNA-binding transcriptional regulator [Massiliimalia massiliensis]|uniref:LacI family DNA-binding transcriptional regulator n=1 Tax=Massiliimalia massiliensis TaxID=1852384 RepID=UPI0009859E92|nr:LacI family DNA-binding transcriptional regulator [Massiliimalia massiliensis]